MSRGLQLTSIAAGGLMLLAAGCAGSGVAIAGTVPAKGVVLMDGKPLSNAVVVFNPTMDQKSGASAITDSNGRFELKSGNAGTPGALPGRYRVLISKFVKQDGSDFVPTPEAAPINFGARDIMPPHCADPVNSTLSQEVPAAGDENMKIEVSSATGPPAPGALPAPASGTMPK